MIYWQGKYHRLERQQYNGAVLGYLYDGLVREELPRRAVIRGHIVTEDGVLIITRRRLPAAVIVLPLLCILCVGLWPEPEPIYYPVSFAEQPLYRRGILYCNVYNDAEIGVSVSFTDGVSTTAPWVLLPGESLPYIQLDFIPTHICYTDYQFTLEVRRV